MNEKRNSTPDGAILGGFVLSFIVGICTLLIAYGADAPHPLRTAAYASGIALAACVLLVVIHEIFH